MISPKSTQQQLISTLRPKKTPGAEVKFEASKVWHLAIPTGTPGQYRLAQLDDYTDLSRRLFPWMPPLTMTLRARSCAESLPGTWGFGFWNDPFSLSLGFGGGTRRAPVLPNAAWFFFASLPNHISLYEDLPGHGSLASTIQSPQIPAPALAIGAFGLPLMFFPPFVRLLRQLSQSFIKQSATHIPLSVTEWHEYSLEWRETSVHFSLDRKIILETPISPNGPLGLVIWLDNQFFALHPDGHVGYGSLANPAPAWIEIDGVEVY